MTGRAPASRAPVLLVSTRGRLSDYSTPLVHQGELTLRAAALEMGLSQDHELGLVFCDNPTIRRINRRWRKIDKATDVLSFPMHELAEGRLPPPGAVGDILISIPTARRAAAEMERDTGDHVDHLIVHGLLHLLGYGHDTDARALRMERLERRLLSGGLR